MDWHALKLVYSGYIAHRVEILFLQKSAEKSHNKLSCILKKISEGTDLRLNEHA